ncbi:MAG: hypothetical protein F4245_06405 [Cenarchaeum sp. SB0678_bin_8]|nr:hypothetical protein [Cenarchaeum sp. SB0666_bin_15]MYD59228.1 hypothetical protein [Cenarchaeum sp. SB0678_bin_8]MYJ27896.1 hypothetical protein [Cenarchaeum sp. SB0672_bin_9]
MNDIPNHIHEHRPEDKEFLREFKEAESDLLQLSGEVGEKVSNTSYAIFISGVCVGALIFLVVLNMYGVPSPGWMSLPLLPAPASILLWNRPSWISRVRWLSDLGIAIILMPSIMISALILTLTRTIPDIVNEEIQSGDVIGMGMSIGVFAIISGLMVIVAGGIVLRLLYVDSEYRKRINVIDEEPGTITHSAQTAQGNSGQSTGDSANNTREKGSGSLSNTYMALGNIKGKMEANRHGIIIDGICMVMICIVGFATALGYSPDLLVSAVVAFACFLCAIMPLQYYIRSTFRLES